MTRVYRLDIAPCPKPRMTQADKWRKRQSVMKFFAFRDAVKQYIESKVVLQSPYHSHHLEFESFDIEFHIPMPKSWSKKKKALHNGQPHNQRPDLDNYIKAWCDSVFQEDSVVWRIKATKRWTSSPGYITINEL